MTISHQLQRFYRFLEQPLFLPARLALLALVVPLALSFAHPLWRISLRAPQYPQGLWMDIYTYQIDGGNHGQHINEINELNHYIGMHKIDRAELSDLDWLPFALGLVGVLALRCAAIGNVRSLVDLVVLTSYITVFAFGRFFYKLYVFGHTLDPAAAFKVEPFTPAILGTKQIANFTTTSLPQLGTFLVGGFALGIIGLLLWHLIAGRLAMLKTEKIAP